MAVQPTLKNDINIMEQTNFQCSLGNTVPNEYLTVAEIIELTDLKIHTIRRICAKLAETKPKEQIRKEYGQWVILHLLLHHFSKKPKRKHYVLGTIAPKYETEPNVLVAIIEFFAKNHPYDIHYSIERNKNQNGNNSGWHIHFVTERTSCYQMTRDLKLLCESNIDIREIKFGEKQATLDYISKNGKFSTIKVEKS